MRYANKSQVGYPFPLVVIGCSCAELRLLAPDLRPKHKIIQRNTSGLNLSHAEGVNQMFLCNERTASNESQQAEYQLQIFPARPQKEAPLESFLLPPR